MYVYVELSTYGVFSVHMFNTGVNFPHKNVGFDITKLLYN